MQSSSWEANSCSAIQDIPSISLCPKFRYSLHNGPPLVQILSRMNPVHALLRYFIQILFNIILPLIPRSSKWHLSFRFSHQNPLRISFPPHIHHMPHPSHSPWFHYPCIWQGVQLWNSSLHNLLQSLVSYFLLGPNICLNSLFWNTPTLCCLFMWQIVFHIHNHLAYENSSVRQKISFANAKIQETFFYWGLCSYSDLA